MKGERAGHALLPALVLALGVGAAGYFVGQTMYNAKVGVDTAEVRGLAERRVEADRAYWSIGYTVSGQQADAIADLYARSKANRARIISVLVESGFETSEITPGVVEYSRQEFRDENQKLVDERHQLTGSIVVETGKVRLVSAARARLNELIAEGIDIRNGAPAYHFTRLNEIKPAMLAEATANARTAANEFAANAGVEVGGIRSARQGSFVIRDVGSSYSETAEIEKDVRVVTSISFYLTD
jgi:hypothetical protein